MEQRAFPDLASVEMAARQKEALDRLVQEAENAFLEKQTASDRRDWCNPVPAWRKVETVQAFLKAFHNEDSLEIATCSVCYLKKKPQDLDRTDWKKAIPDEIRSPMAGLLACKTCFPEADGEAIVPICVTCRAALDRRRVPDACMGATMLTGCEHRYPNELRDLTPLEEKLISLIFFFSSAIRNGHYSFTRPSQYEMFAAGILYILWKQSRVLVVVRSGVFCRYEVSGRNQL